MAGLVCVEHCRCRQTLENLQLLKSTLKYDVRRRAGGWNRRRASSLAMYAAMKSVQDRFDSEVRTRGKAGSKPDVENDALAPSLPGA